MTWSNDGDKHDRRCLAVAIAVGGAVTLSGQLALGIKMALTISVWGLLFSPDLDLADTGRHQGGGCKAWHRWKRAGLGWFWKPYGYAFKHRSKFSHSLIPGTLLRLLYVLVLPLLFLTWHFRTELFHFLTSLEDLNPEQLAHQKEIVTRSFVYIGCCFIADAVHLLTDSINPKEWFQ